jgi:hypothetical protein
VLFGRDRSSGGDFEQAKLELRRFDAEGRLLSSECWDVDRGADALARFEEIARGEAGPRVRPNLATQQDDRFDAAIAARDAEALARQLADDFTVVHHPSGRRYGRDEHLRSWRIVFAGATQIELRRTALATLGERSSLCRRAYRSGGIQGTDVSAGPGETDELALVEVDASGRTSRTEIFASHQLADAIVRLYERHADGMPEGSARETARGIAASLALIFGPQDADAWRPAIAPDVVARDWRTVGYGTLRGREAALASFRTLIALSGRVETRIHGVLRVEPHGLALRWGEGGELPGGGLFERELCVSISFGDDGRITRWEQFDAEQEAEALARFEAFLEHAVPPAARPGPGS